MTEVAVPIPSPSRRERATALGLVFAQFVLIAALVLLPAGSAWTVPAWVEQACRLAAWVGIVVMIIGATGLGRGLTALPLPNGRAQLRTGGLYRIVRHPIYTGLLLFAVASTVPSGNVLTAVTCALLMVLLNVKARWEERRLVQRFPDYRGYAERTGRFVPLPRPVRSWGA
jgi:protein-S-isoprenylcysteine O-methyltransferase Ste14